MQVEEQAALLKNAEIIQLETESDAWNSFIQSPLCRGIALRQCGVLYQNLKPWQQSYRKNQTVFVENSLVTRIGLVQSGCLASSCISYEGGQHLATLWLPGELVGVDALYTPSQNTPVRIFAVSPAKVVWFSGSSLLRLCQHPSGGESVATLIALNQNMLCSLAYENRKKQHKMNFLAQPSVRGKIMEYLRYMADLEGSNSFEIQMDREQLAQFLNVNRSSLCHELSRMRREGLLEVEKNRFCIIESR